ncbi:MAG TPA: ABC transporter permease [Thermotogota bacterium]|nr:ABC transporter permease [Thermotogota bacterium]HRW92937.1 ABC transporter permease [Thermotogota bacterium]
MAKTKGKNIWTLGGIALFFGTWWLLARFIASPLILPGPWQVLQVLFEMARTGTVFWELLRTFSKGILGLGIALALGLPFGLLMGSSPKMEELFRPLTMVIRSMPVVSWLSTVLVIWGIGFRAPVFIVVVSLLPVIIFNVSQGVATVDTRLMEMARVYRVSRWEIFRQVYLGSIFPFLLSAVKVSLGTMWKVAIVAEYLAGNTGIGIQLSWSKFYLDTPAVFAYTLLALVAGLGFEYAFEFLFRKWKVRGVESWQHS